MLHLTEGTKIADCVAPQEDWQNITGRAIDVGNAIKVFVVIQNIEDAGTVTYDIERNDAADTGWIAIANNAKVWSNLDTTENDTLVRRNNAVNYETNAAGGEKMVVFEVDPASLGLHTASDDPCTQIRLRCTTGAEDDVGSALYFVDSRYKQATPPEVRV